MRSDDLPGQEMLKGAVRKRERAQDAYERAKWQPSKVDRGEE